MKKNLFIIIIASILIICGYIIIRKNGDINKQDHRNIEELIYETDISNYLNDDLAELLSKYINSLKVIESPFKSVIIITFQYENKKPYVYFIHTYFYDSSIIDNGYFIFNDFLILFAETDNLFFEKNVKALNLGYGMPEGYINESSDKMSEAIDYDGHSKRILIGQNGELIPE